MFWGRTEDWQYWFRESQKSVRENWLFEVEVGVKFWTAM